MKIARIKAYKISPSFKAWKQDGSTRVYSCGDSGCGKEALRGYFEKYPQRTDATDALMREIISTALLEKGIGEATPDEG